MAFDDDSSPFCVIINDEEQYSLWPISLALPPGWRGCSFSGSKAECLAFIDHVWMDMRSLSLRRSANLSAPAR
ncbi:MbtH family protein [Telmatospirillum siberiense]|uniref:MbtH family protein n=1 Tax=Telmatospirillum siberiense TaxID=382514 RepID=A0A2N3PUM7_9PROT|nr:MbtH family NRPS accessory protein [Telmatospirillum siberiense]PKU24104.1 MbtH family protein [Telmatospirillum siberiense]